MHIRIVTFQLAGIDERQYLPAATAAAHEIAGWPGLAAKFWLADRATATYGGVYLFDDAASAEASTRTPVFRAMAANPAFAELAVREFHVLDEPTALTRGGATARP